MFIHDNHSLFGCGCEDIDINVHGGVTYVQSDAGLYAVGFDCAHPWDLIPSKSYDDSFEDNQKYFSYKNIDFVIDNVKLLSRELKILETVNNKLQINEIRIRIKELFTKLNDKAYVSLNRLEYELVNIVNAVADESEK